MKILESLKEIFKVSSERGMHLPMAYDADKEGPSITLLIFYVAMLMTVGSLTAFHFLPDKLLQPSLLTLLFLGLSFVFYRMRNLDKVKFDLDDRSIELEGGNDEQAGNGGGNPKQAGSEATQSEGTKDS